MSNQEFVFNIFIKKLIDLHTKIHACVIAESKYDEEYFLNKYFRLYETMCGFFNKEKVDQYLIQHSKERKIGLGSLVTN